MAKFYPDHGLLVQQMGDRINRLLKKNGLDEFTIANAVMAYNYFDADERIQKKLSKMTGRTVSEDIQNYHDVLLYCCQILDFAKLIIPDRKKAEQVHQMACEIQWGG